MRELKQHLSKYLERAARGEVVVVTDRGVAEGWITPPKRTDGLGSPVRQRSSKRIVDVLLEDRGE